MSDNDSHFSIGTALATWDDKAEKPKGIARFTAAEWSSPMGMKTLSRSSVEVELEFDPETRQWSVKGLKQWDGGF
jgi:hypothetical protein